MSSKAEKERQKQIQDKCQALLNQMLRDEDNKYCVDCDAKGPRWASWNLGIFLCIRCAGIHRNLGVHISKVKSVNLDSWTPEQVVSLQQMGNSRARAVYEANLPDQFRRPQNDSALEAFVRAKYEAKKYIAREWVPPALPKVNWDKELDEEAERVRRKKREGKTAPISSSLAAGIGRKALDSVIAQPLPKPTTSPKPQRSPCSNTPTMVQRNAPVSADLLGLDSSGVGEKPPSSVGSGGDDLFSSFLSAPGNSPRHSDPATVPTTAATTTTGITPLMSSKRTPEEESFFNQLSSAGKKQLTTDSILALYAKVPLQPPLFGSGGGSGYLGQSVGVLQQGLGMPQGVGGVPLTQGTGVVSGLHGSIAMPQGVGILPQAVGVLPQGINLPQVLPQGVGLPQTVGVQPAIGGFLPSGFTITNGVASQNNMQSGLFGALGGATPANVNIASNPFYNMASTVPPAAHQQQSFPSANKISQQMSGLNLAGVAPSNPYTAPVQFPASTQLGQTLATNLWQ